MIEGIVAEIEVGRTYQGKVVGVKEFGCFVEVLPGKDGMVHISELANFRVAHVEDVCKVGDEMWVKCIGIDDKGRVRLSRKAAMAEKDEAANAAAARPPTEGGALASASSMGSRDSGGGERGQS
jgi:polyribonucleotide nucleotidyltransferase